MFDDSLFCYHKQNKKRAVLGIQYIQKHCVWIPLENWQFHCGEFPMHGMISWNRMCCHLLNQKWFNRFQYIASEYKATELFRWNSSILLYTWITANLKCVIFFSFSFVQNLLLSMKHIADTDTIQSINVHYIQNETKTEDCRSSTNIWHHNHK